eukprot:2961748-Rhodomonas_salina.3
MRGRQKTDRSIARLVGRYRLDRTLEWALSAAHLRVDTVARRLDEAWSTAQLGGACTRIQYRTSRRSMRQGSTGHRIARAEHAG